VRWGILVVAVAACAQPPPPRQTEFPTLALSDTYHTRIADLRTTLARGGIALKISGFATTFETDACDPSGSQVGTCVRCDLASEKTRIDGAVIEAATKAFARYPTEVLAASKIAHVAVCTEIVYRKEGELDRPGGLADPVSRGLLLGVKYFAERTYTNHQTFTVEDVAHHEVFHLLEYERMRDEVTSDSEWHLHNPLGFEYSTGYQNEKRREGFVNSYAMTAPQEDKASVFEMVMAHPDELCEMAKTDEIIRIKTRILFRRVFKAVGTDQFMRERAPCIDWLD
jgi:hypothetical protein